jgi:hypothetical protein
MFVFVFLCCVMLSCAGTGLCPSQWRTPPLRLQVSACSTFLMACDVPSMAVFVGNLLSVVLVLFPDILLLLLLLCFTR